MPIKRSNSPSWADVMSLFQYSVGSKFVIPVYQRNYVWEAKKEVKVLLDDYYALISNNKNHFIGIIIDYLASSNSRNHKYYVIDGQQRLTTLFLLIRALKQRAIEESNEEIKAQLDLCLNVYPNKSEYKLEPLMSDGDVFKKILDGNFGKLSEEEKATKVASAYAYICNFVANATKTISLSSLVDALDRLYLVEIPLDKDDDAQQIFESLNFKGSPLMATDLIRNYVLMCTEDEKKDGVFINNWRPFEAKFSDTQELEKFFRFFVMSQTEEFVKKNDVYCRFREWVDDKLHVISIENVISYVDKYATSYDFLYKKDLSGIKDESVWKTLKDYRNIESEMPAPLMLEIATLYLDGDIDGDQFVEITNIINTFVLRRAIIGMDTSGITRFFTTVIKTIMMLCDSSYSNIVDVVQYCVVDGNNGKSSRMPDDVELSSSLETLNVYDNALALHCFFDKYENEKMTNPVQTMNYQIEHIMPQDGSKWLSVVGLTENEYNAQTGRIGNLTLTTKHDNPAMSNNLFDYKQAILKDTAGFRLNADVYSLPAWDKNAIDKRNADMIKELIRLYPYKSSIDKAVYDEQIIKSKSLPKMDELIEWGVVNKGDKLCLGRYKESSEAILIDSDHVSFGGETLKISQWISKVYGNSAGTNPYNEIYIVGETDSLDSLRNSYMKEHAVESSNSNDTGFRDLLALKIIEFLETKETEDKSIEVLTKANTYIRFAGIKTRNKVGLKGDGTWSNIQDLIVYEIYNSLEKGVNLSLYIGPGEMPLREKWLNYAINSKVLNPTHFKLRAKWNCISNFKLSDPRTSFTSDEDYYKTVLNNLSSFFAAEFDKCETEFENAPSDLESEVFKANSNSAPCVVYDENYHLNNASKEVNDIYSKLKELVIEVNNDIKPVATKVYIAFKYHGRNIFDVEVFKTKLRICLNIKKGMLNDPENKCRDITHIGTHGNGDYDIIVSNASELNYLIGLIKQCLEFDINANENKQ